MSGWYVGDACEAVRVLDITVDLYIQFLLCLILLETMEDLWTMHAFLHPGNVKP